MSGAEKPSEVPQKPKGESTKMSPEALRAYGEKRVQAFKDIAAREKVDSKMTPQEIMAKTIHLAPDNTELGKMQREFQFLVRKRYQAMEEKMPINPDFEDNFQKTVMMLKNADKDPYNKAMYQQLQ